MCWAGWLLLLRLLFAGLITCDYVCLGVSLVSLEWVVWLLGLRVFRFSEFGLEFITWHLRVGLCLYVWTLSGWFDLLYDLFWGYFKICWDDLLVSVVILIALLSFDVGASLWVCDCDFGLL